MNDLPKDFSNALDEAGLSEFFAACTKAHCREYLKWIDEAKRPDARQARIEKAVKMIAAKRAEEQARTKKPAKLQR